MDTIFVEPTLLARSVSELFVAAGAEQSAADLIASHLIEAICAVMTRTVSVSSRCIWPASRQVAWLLGQHLQVVSDLGGMMIVDAGAVRAR